MSVIRGGCFNGKTIPDSKQDNPSETQELQPSNDGEYHYRPLEWWDIDLTGKTLVWSEAEDCYFVTDTKPKAGAK